MSGRHAFPFALLALALLGGCATTSPEARRVLDEAQAELLAIRTEPAVRLSAAKDLERAEESLERAERFSSYLGSEEDVLHYAYLSRRYSQIAREHGAQRQAAERVAQLEKERERLQLALSEARLITAEQQGEWLEEQLLGQATTETERGLVMTLGDVLFDTGRAELRASATRTVLQVAKFLRLNQRRVVRIEGYTDSQGDAALNLELSRGRARSVRDMLVDLGVDGKRIQVAGYGEAYPVAENASNQGRARNRRVEIVFSDEEGTLGAER
ncbi:Outer membrane protein OmpA [Azotobacter beijerinckii]|uniref:Outer membrane protein OmpA n=1 Tax=Azotobacter beijerinckii TaxID=170623 RepID=A0A1H6WJC5_9GAMM|nr:OmpA family protein [Azotobacter beijerinckii]SEJ15816.1 Outer membrane protein OmpA [Azotobacter beijerinckii]